MLSTLPAIDGAAARFLMPDTAVNSNEPMDALRVYVQQNGMKRSKQRDLIAEVFFSTTEHLRVDDLLDRVRAEDPKIGQATVYRTLKLLEKAGLAEAHQFGDGHTRYEPHQGDEEHHDHLICRTCGEIIEFFNPNRMT